MFDGADLNTTFSQRGGPLHLLHFFQEGRNGGLIGQIHPTELITSPSPSRLHGQSHLGAAMQGNPCHACLLKNRSLSCRTHPDFLHIFHP